VISGGASALGTLATLGAVASLASHNGALFPCVLLVALSLSVLRTKGVVPAGILFGLSALCVVGGLALAGYFGLEGDEVWWAGLASAAIWLPPAYASWRLYRAARVLQPLGSPAGSGTPGGATKVRSFKLPSVRATLIVLGAIAVAGFFAIDDYWARGGVVANMMQGNLNVLGWEFPYRWLAAALVGLAALRLLIAPRGLPDPSAP
jgi:hypothetical protein